MITELQHKQCCTCKEFKTLDMFSKNKSSKDGFKSRCKLCVKQESAQYAEKHKCIIAIRKQEYRAKNRKTLSQKQCEYQKNNSEKVALYKASHYAKNKERIKSKARAYGKTDRGRAVYINSRGRRRAIIKQGQVSIAFIQKLKNSQHCHWCKSILTYGNIHIDHVVPLSRGGLHSEDNLVASCPTCNLKKNNLMPEVFIKRLSNI